MMKLKITVLFLFVVHFSFGQEFFQIIGLESDDSEFSKGSYAVMYDSQSEKRENTQYTPYQSIGIYRNKNTVEIMNLDYLLIPTKKGFLYGTLEVIEKKGDPLTDDIELPEDVYYEYTSSVTKPKFFKNKKSVINFIKHQNPKFKDALIIDFEKISFINSNFYITKGFDSKVHGGATWFNATEKINIYPLDWKGKLSNRIIDYINNEAKNKIIINTVLNLEDYGFDEDINENSGLPWGGSINDHQDVFYDICFRQKGVHIIPYTLLNGNSSRSFLAEGKAIKNQKIYDALNLNTAVDTNDNNQLISFFSPDGTTEIKILEKTLIIIDVKSKTILKEVKLNYNKIVMSEFASGKYAKKWKDQF